MKKLTIMLVIFMLGLGIASKVYAREGRDAGYQWAQEHAITDPSYDDPNDSDSFKEGVRQYAEEQDPNSPMGRQPISQ